MIPLSSHATSHPGLPEADEDSEVRLSMLGAGDGAGDGAADSLELALAWSEPLSLENLT